MRLLVLTHEPTECYAVDELLRDLNDESAPDTLSSVPMWISRDKGWTPEERATLTKV